MTFGFIKKVFFCSNDIFSFNPLSVSSLECVSMNKQKGKIRTKIVDINNNEHTFYLFSVKVNKWGGSCSNIIDPYT